MTAINEIKQVYLDWFNADLPEKKEAPKALYEIGEILKKFGLFEEKPEVNTLNQMGAEIDKDKTVEKHFLVPINSLLLKLTLVQKDTDRKNVKAPYVKAEILIPKEIGKTVPEVMNSDWKLLLMGVKQKK